MNVFFAKYVQKRTKESATVIMLENTLRQCLNIFDSIIKNATSGK